MQIIKSEELKPGDDIEMNYAKATLAEVAIGEKIVGVEIVFSGSLDETSRYRKFEVGQEVILIHRPDSA
jgi:hypothetical protein